MRLRKAPANGKVAQPEAPSAREILLVGCEGAGKTLLCRQFERQCAAPAKGKKKRAVAVLPPLNAATQPSIGIELLSLRHRSRLLPMREIGGTMQPVWDKYFGVAAAVLFVADSSAAEGATGALIELLELLQQIPDKRFLLFVNKRDDPNALPDATLRRLLAIPELEATAGDGRLSAVFGSALTGTGVSDALDWCADALHEMEQAHALKAAKERQEAANRADAAAKSAKVNSDVNAAAAAEAQAAKGAEGVDAASKRAKKRWRGFRRAFAVTSAFRNADVLSAEHSTSPAR